MTDREHHTDLVESLVGALVRQCIDVERLAALEQSLILAMTDRDHDDATAAEIVQTQIDAAWQSLMFEFDHIRRTGCALCAMAERHAGSD